MEFAVGTIVVITPGPKPEEGYISELGNVFEEVPLRKAMYAEPGERYWIGYRNILPNILGCMLLVEITESIRDTSERGELRWKCRDKSGTLKYDGGFAPDIFEADRGRLAYFKTKYPDKFSELPQ